MNDIAPLTALHGVSDVYVNAVLDLHKIFRTTVKILVVVDGGISLTEGPGAPGVGRVIRLLRESHIGCKYFSVDTARRENTNAGTPTYQNFRFDQKNNGQPVINRYHEIWCFGFNPGNDAGADSNITQADALPLSNAEVSALSKWMDERCGGVLAMGDHDYLGASMCHRIPRVRSMRRWTNAQGVPPIGGYARHDTNQPFTAAQMNGSAVIPNNVERDAKPQPLDWVPWMSESISLFKIRSRPHPVLCHPTHGPIDVMPDHPHEGWCYEDHDITLGGGEYPDVAGQPHGPTVIAHGTTTPDPPYDLAKGASPKKRFGIVSVYDGHPAEVGRVAVDSTWHHWFDMNIQGIEAAGGENWDKISRYYLNLAVWLAPPGLQNGCFAFESIKTHFTYAGFQEYTRKASVFELGHALHAHLTAALGPCWVSEWVLDKLRLVDDDIWAWLKDKLFWGKGGPAPGDPCLSCPPFEFIEAAVLGGVVRANMTNTDDIKAQHAKKPERAFKFDAERLFKQQLEGVELGLKEFRTALAKSIKQTQRLLR